VKQKYTLLDFWAKIESSHIIPSCTNSILSYTNSILRYTSTVLSHGPTHPLCIRGHVGEGVDVERNEETVEEVVSNDLVEGVHAK